MKKTTNLDYVIKSIDKFKFQFDYSNVDLSGLVSEDSKIICKKHGEFLQPMRTHFISKKGCPKCGRERPCNDFDYWENKVSLSNIHGFRIESIIANSRGSVTLFCEKHGPVKVSMVSFLKTGNCSLCSREKVAESQRKSRDERIEYLLKLHSGKYDYSLFPEKIISNKIKVKIICKEHGVFEQRLNEHMLGKGCSSCSISSCSTGYINYVRIKGKIKCIKFGISNNPKRRLSEINSKTKYEVISHSKWSFPTHQSCRDAESMIKRLVKPFLSKEEFPEGWTETCDLSYKPMIIEVFKKFGGKRD